ncbi:hypothetical protein [Bradyrhizobium sp.]|uniref:hypothetical protein n=1 Tax=Bradyrhizobium sp. TaxID=376 RepID=UPI0023A022C0|nr:hypothetical protein [Bradyrhizobium sp.]MDE2063443.1 hypothetical protein [Bradyrhizobium sp.]
MASHGRVGGIAAGSACFRLIHRKAALLNGADGYQAHSGSIQMMDVLMIALTFGFFALAIGYAYACERL